MSRTNRQKKIRKRGKRCRGKICYLNRNEADKHAEIASRRLKEVITSYKCEKCGAYHIGHNKEFE